MSDPVLDVDEAVFDVVERIPPGRVSTYGAIGRLVGIGPRRVARALSSGGGAVPWFRVVRADGSVAEPVRVRQLELLAAEGVPMRERPGGPGRRRVARLSVLPACVRLPPCAPFLSTAFSSPIARADTGGMNTMACRAVAEAGLSAGTASLDDEAAWPLLLVAGWLTTAADLMKEAELRETVLI